MPRAHGLALWRFFLIISIYLTYTLPYWLLLKLYKPWGLRFGRHYLSLWRRCIGHTLIVKGTMSTVKPTFFAANHSSYVDILVLGTLIPARFVAKTEVSEWPVMGWLATKQDTIYIDRSRTAITKGTDKLATYVDQGDSLILFPEGTTTDGCRVLPFKSSFFDVAMKKNMIVQPVSIAYAGWNGLAMPQFLRKLCGWQSPDIDLLSHLWMLAQLGTVDVVVEFHPPVKAQDFASRKELATASFHAVRDGLANAFSTPLHLQGTPHGRKAPLH